MHKLIHIDSDENKTRFMFRSTLSDGSNFETDIHVDKLHEKLLANAVNKEALLMKHLHDLVDEKVTKRNSVLSAKEETVKPNSVFSIDKFPLEKEKDNALEKPTSKEEAAK